MSSSQGRRQLQDLKTLVCFGRKRETLIRTNTETRHDHKAKTNILKSIFYSILNYIELPNVRPALIFKDLSINKHFFHE